MGIKPCPKCGSTATKLYSNICETTTNGFGVRLHWQQCRFTLPKSKWHWYSTAKAIEIWNKYKRKERRVDVE